MRRMTVIDGGPMASLRRTMVLTVALAVTAALVVISPANAAPRFLDVIVVLEGEPGRADGRAVAEATARQHGVEASFVYEHALRGFAGRVPEGRLNGLRNDPRVSYVESDGVVQVASQTVPTGVQRIFADANPAIPTTGSGKAVDVDVAVLDTGIDRSHPDLDVVASVDCTLTTGGGPPWSRTSYCGAGGTDGNGHGTHVAGTIGARDNGSGVVGVAPGARLWSIKVLADDGSGTFGGIIAGIDHVTANAGRISVANMSLAGPGSSKAIDDAIDRSVAAGVTYVLAAGNEFEDVKNWTPAGHPKALTVSALADYDGLPGGKASTTCGNGGLDDSFATFSNFGAVDLIAPGVCILSTVPGGGYGTMSGTSMAAPHVAGAAALLASNGTKDGAIREALVVAGNDGYSSAPDPDGSKEPLLDVSDIVPTLVGGSDDGDGPGDGGPGDEDGDVPDGVWLERLEGSATKAQSQWAAIATVTVKDGASAAGGVTVHFGYRTARGQTGEMSCLTSDAGICSVEHVVANREGSVTFTVTKIGSTPLESAESVTVIKP
jgi:subtilisin